MTIAVSAARVARGLTLTVFFLVLLSTATQIYAHFGAYFTGLDTLTRLFDVDYENSLPTLATLVLQLVAISVLWLIFILKRRANDRFTRHWLGLTLIFGYLFVDEGSMIHETVGIVLREALGTTGILYFAWVIPAALLLIVFAALYLRFLVYLPADTRLLMVGAGMIFVGGALGVELFEGYYYSLYGDSLLLNLAEITEESMEMLGLVLFSYALLRYLQKHVERVQFSWVRRATESKTKSPLPVAEPSD